MEIKSTLLILALLTTSSMSSDISIKTKKLDNSFCKKTKVTNNQGLEEEINYCMNSEISYPIIKSFNPKLKTHLENAINEILETKVDSKKHVLSVIKDNEATRIGTQAHLTVKFLSLTKRTFSLGTITDEYFGGRHGEEHTTFSNYDRASGKKIVLDNLFIKGYEKKLLKISEKVYRKKMNLKAFDNLSEKDSWIENKFKLPKSIGIAYNGLQFKYNHDEIRYRSAGTVSLVIPYFLLKEIIPSNSYLSDFGQMKTLKNTPTQHFDFHNSKANLELDVHRVSSSEIKLTVLATNNSNSQSDSTVSVSFPQLEDKMDIYKYEKNDFTKVLIYPKKSSIYNFKKKEAIKSDYLLVEGEVKKWKANEKKTMVIHVSTSSDMKTLKINLRTTLKENQQTITIPFSGIEGQQGTSNYQVELKLK